MKQKDSLIRALKGKRGGTRVLYFYKEHEMVRPKKTDDTITPLGQELIEAAEAMLAHSRGEEWTKDFKSTIYTVPDRVDVKKIRTSMHLTQEQFAHFIGAGERPETRSIRSRSVP